MVLLTLILMAGARPSEAQFEPRPVFGGARPAAWIADPRAPGTWERLASEESRMQWWRQTPHCMMDQGKLHPGLTVDGNTNWGATLEGSTVIREVRLANRTMYVAIQAAGSRSLSPLSMITLLFGLGLLLGLALGVAAVSVLVRRDRSSATILAVALGLIAAFFVLAFLTGNSAWITERYTR